MKFVVKDMDIATGDILVAILNQDDAKLLDLRPEDRVLLKKGRKEVIVILDISESKKAVPKGKIGLFEEVLDRLNVKQGAHVEVLITRKPRSVQLIRNKLHGKKLSYKDFYEIMDDFSKDRLTAVEKTYFVSGNFCRGLDMTEVVQLTKAMVDTGSPLKFKHPVYDLHSIGGVPNNRTTMIVIPIVAVAGLQIPKTASRAITSPSGTADTMEVLCDVSLTAAKLKKVVKKTNGCIAWGGAMNIAPADDKIIDIEHPLAIDAVGQMIASVMAKKASVSASHLLLEIPVGREAKAKNRKEALALGKKFVQVGKRLNIKVRIFIATAEQPVGFGIGPVLEVIDVLKILENQEDAPKDLREKSLHMAGLLLEMSGKKQGYKLAKTILESGLALKKFNEIVEAQGAKNKKWSVGKFRYDYKSKKSGKIKDFDNTHIAKIARLAGAPENIGAGIFLYKKIGQDVKKGEVVYTVYSESKPKLQFAKEAADRLVGFKI